MSPIVDDVVKDIEAAAVGAVGVEAAGEAPVATLVVGEEVVVEAGDVAADARGVAVRGAGRVVLVAGDVQRLGDERALQGEVFALRVLMPSSWPQLTEQ